MKMEFIFNENELAKEGLSKAECLNCIRQHFAKWNKYGTIEEVQEGVFIGKENDINAFGSTMSLTNTNWFLKVIKEWYWYIDGEKEDCLESYNRVVLKNA